MTFFKFDFDIWHRSKTSMCWINFLEVEITNTDMFNLNSLGYFYLLNSVLPSAIGRKKNCKVSLWNLKFELPANYQLLQSDETFNWIKKHLFLRQINPISLIWNKDLKINLNLP